MSSAVEPSPAFGATAPATSAAASSWTPATSGATPPHGMGVPSSVNMIAPVSSVCQHGAGAAASAGATSAAGASAVTPATSGAVVTAATAAGLTAAGAGLATAGAAMGAATGALLLDGLLGGVLAMKDAPQPLPEDITYEPGLLDRTWLTSLTRR